MIAQSSRRAVRRERPGGQRMREAARRIGDPVLKLDHISLAFGGVQRADRHLVRRPRARGSRDHRPQRRRQELDAQRDQRRLPAAAGHDHLPRQGAARHGHARRRGGGHRAHVPEHRALSRHVGARQHHDGPQSQDEGDVLEQAIWWGRARERGARASAQGRGGDRVPRDPAHPQDAGRAACRTACRSGSSSPARSPPSPRSCCWTSRWRG